MTDARETMRLALETLHAAIDELNLDLPEPKQLPKDPATVLFGPGSRLDSLDLVRLVVLYETELADATDRAISISDDRAMSEERSHFQTIETLARYAAQLIEDEGNIGD